MNFCKRIFLVFVIMAILGIGVSMTHAQVAHKYVITKVEFQPPKQIGEVFGSYYPGLTILTFKDGSIRAFPGIYKGLIPLNREVYIQINAKRMEATGEKGGEIVEIMPVE